MNKVLPVLAKKERSRKSGGCWREGEHHYGEDPEVSIFSCVQGVQMEQTSLDSRQGPGPVLHNL